MNPQKWASLSKDEWTESPYYTYSVQKLIKLNNKEDFSKATNWETPMAFFTRCFDYDPNKKLAYFSRFIGGWSHTYCNFEIDPETPIVIKIHRRTQEEMDALGIVSDAPKGPITSAAAYPKRKVESCNIIKGDVYVTMNNPGLIVVDIDKQMDGRDAPRAIASGWAGDVFPYKDEKLGAHGVTIFANPVIEGKPDITDKANVFVVNPGQKPPVSFTQPVLYFAPGVHRLSVDEKGNIRDLELEDIIVPISSKSYYIPGDAIVYGNINGFSSKDPVKDVRVFGHGTLSGRYISHFKDRSSKMPFENSGLRMLNMKSIGNVVYEGVTIANPPEHTVKLDSSFSQSPNYIKWCKSIAWRVNNDGMTVMGNSYIQDCFLRHQDDGSYIRGMGIARTSYWSDVNGSALRASFITSDRGKDYPATLSPNLVVEDCDIIYCRAAFIGGNEKAKSVAVIGSFEGKNELLRDGAKNTAQHIIIRNLTVSDPKPQRSLISANSETTELKGLCFENINQEHKHAFGAPISLVGLAPSLISNWIFKNVRIGGVLVDEKVFNDTKHFNISNASDMKFK